MNITNDERREVAERLRALDADDWGSCEEELGAIYSATGCNYGQEHQDDDLHERLADLIEPAPPSSDRGLTRLREAMLDMAGEMESDADGGTYFTLFARPAVRNYARRIREYCEGGSDAHDGNNEAADGARATSMDVLRWVKDRGGLDEVKRRVWASNELRDKLRSRERKIERLKKALGYADAKNAERRAGAKWLKEHGGLDKVRSRFNESGNRRVELCEALGIFEGTTWEDAMAAMRRRLMPEGMEWPRFEDDAPLKFGDIALIDGDADMVEAVQFWIHGMPVIYGDGGSQQLEKGDRVKRPAPKVLDADGVEIRVGDTVWTVESLRQGTVKQIIRAHDGKWRDTACVDVVFNGHNHGNYVMSDLLTHRAPVLAADGKPLHEGETAWDKDGTEWTIACIDIDFLPDCVQVRGADRTSYVKPSQLTHKRPDSFEQLEKDANDLAYDIGFYLGDYSPSDFKEPGDTIQDRIRDIVRRAKALAERDA